MQYPKQTDNYDVDIFNANFRELAGSVISLDTEKFDKTEAQGLFKDVAFNRGNGVITFTLYDGSVKTIDTLLEKLAVNFDFDRETQRLIITLDDGTEKYVDLSAFITQYEFLDSETIAFVLGEDGKVSAKIKEGSIEEKHLRPNYLADIKTEAAKAEAARQDAQESQRETEEAEANAVASAAASAENANSARTAAEEALEAKTKAQKAAVDAESYAHGGTGTREGEDTDNADFYYQQSKALHDDILAAGGASEENAGLMSAHDKSWVDGKFRRYVYGADKSGDADNGYYKIASVETDRTYRTFGLMLRLWSDNFTNYATNPVEMTIYFRTNNNSVASSVFVYIDVNSGASNFYKGELIFIKHSANPETSVPNGTEKCEIYFNRRSPYAKIVVEVLGETQRGSTSSEENYQNVWTFYDNTEIYESIEEEGYEVGTPIHYAAPVFSNAGNSSTPIYLENGVLKECTDLPSGGTTDYNDLDNKPLINGVELSGNKTASNLMVVKSTGTTNLGINKPDIAIGYVSGTTPIYGNDDGAMYEHAYSDLWCHQIYGDYRTGQIATRGRNNGTWGAFRRQLDEFNYSNFINSYDNAIHARNANIGDNKYIKIIIDRSKADAKSNGFFGAFTVRIYENYRATDYLISGYNYLAGSTAWLNPCASILGGTPFIENGSRGVKFGYDSDEEVYVIFDIGQYVGVSVFGFVEGYYSLTNDINIRKIFRIEFVPEITGTIEKMVTCYYPIHHHEQNMYIGGGQASLRYESLGLMSVLPAGPSAIRYYFKSFTEAEGGGGMFMPSSNGGVHLGTSDHRWRDIYLATAPNVSSDSREKTDQKPLDDELTEKFVLGLTPKSYKRIDGTSGRRHHGLIAPEVEELMNTLGISSLDFAGFVKSPKMEEEEYEDPETGESQTRRILIEGEYTYSLRYEEFIPMLIKMIQLQHSRIKVLENENLQLSERVARIEEYLELV